MMEESTLVWQRVQQQLLQRRKLLWLVVGLVILTAVVVGLIWQFKAPVRTEVRAPAGYEIPAADYTVEYTIRTEKSFGEVQDEQNQRLVISRLGDLWKSERFANEIVQLESAHNTPRGLFICRYLEGLSCERAGDARPMPAMIPLPELAGLTVQVGRDREIVIGGQTWICTETSYQLEPGQNDEDLIQSYDAIICLDKELGIPLVASIEASYRVNDITEFLDYKVEYTREATSLEAAPLLIEADFNPPA
jgi:hypothetical protein